MRFLVAALVAAAALPASSGAATFYVSPHGSDAAAGTSPGRAWRTVARVDRAHLAPGDRVLFAGGARFAGTLTPPASGTSGRPVVFGSYGGSRARLASPRGAVWLAPGTSHVRFQGLDLSTHSDVGVLASAGEGAGSADVEIVGCVLHDTGGTAVLASQPVDTGWLIADDLIEQTGDSGIILLGSHMTVAGTRILDTGTSSTISWDKHGIYAKGPYVRVENDTIRGFQADGVSLRFRGGQVTGTTISGGPIGIAFLADEAGAATTTIARNSVTATRSAIYVAPGDRYPTRESFVIDGNRIASTGGNAIDVEHTAGSVSIHDNRSAGSFPIALAVAAPDGGLSEGGNDWISTRPATYLIGGRSYATVADLRRSTGLGAGDTLH